MTLGEKQRLFSKLVATLIQYAYALGYEIAIAYAYRAEPCNEAVGGHPSSNHTRKLAIDLDLFLEGEYLSDSTDHRELGEFWERLHPLCRWGGRFGESEPGAGDGWDGNHYSLEHEGVR